MALQIKTRIANFVDRIARRHGYVLVHRASAPRQLAWNFAYEMEEHLAMTQDIYGQGTQQEFEKLDKTLTLYVEILGWSLGAFKYLAETPAPQLNREAIRWRATRIATYMLFLADIYGDLSASNTERHRNIGLCSK